MGGKNATPAFPISKDRDCIFINSGHNAIPLRDWLAGQAVAGLFAYYSGVFAHNVQAPEIAQMAYSVADAMLKTREE